MNDPRVYFLKALRSKAVKIGTSSDVTLRLASLRAQYGSRLVLVGTVPGDERYEKTLHRAFAEYRIRGEWFRCDGRLAAFLSLLPSLPEDVRPPSKRRIPDLRQPVRIDSQAMRSIYLRWLAVFRDIVDAYGAKRFALVHGFKQSLVEDVLKDKRLAPREMQLDAADIASPEQRKVIADLVSDALDLGMDSGHESPEDKESRQRCASIREVVLDQMGEEQLAVLDAQVYDMSSDGVLARLKYRVAKRFGEAGSELIEAFERDHPVDAASPRLAHDDDEITPGEMLVYTRVEAIKRRRGFR